MLVKQLDLDSYFQEKSQDLYSFSYILIPDDLQASQLIIDSISTMFVMNKSMIVKWTRCDELEFKSYESEIFRMVLKTIYELALKRFEQIKVGLGSSHRVLFHELTLEEKSALFLKEKFHLDLETISFILDSNSLEVLSRLKSARLTLIEQIKQTQISSLGI